MSEAERLLGLITRHRLVSTQHLYQGLGLERERGAIVTSRHRMTDAIRLIGIEEQYVI